MNARRPGVNFSLSRIHVNFMKTVPSTQAIVTLVGAALLLASITLGITKARSFFSQRALAVTAARELPPVILWAWERPTELRFIDPKETAVAFLARTIRLRSSQVNVRPRLQPLNLPEGARVIAVARIESDPRKTPLLSDQQRNELTGAISEMALLPNVLSIQIDFDATQSERAFYRDVIFEVRRRLPKNVGLSITALASWCSDDDWISDLPIDEAVPMLFRMGPDRRQIRNRLASGEEFPAGPCRSSYGISTDEPVPGLSSVKRLYVFNPDAWTETTVRAITDSRK